MFNSKKLSIITIKAHHSKLQLIGNIFDFFFKMFNILNVSKSVLEQQVHIFRRREETGKQLVQGFVLQSFLLRQEGISWQEWRRNVA